MRKINVLVTAIGGELALSVLKALEVSELDLNIIGCDIFDEVAGEKWCSAKYLVPLASNQSAYLTDIRNILHEENIDVLIPTADVEFPLYASLDDDELPCKVLVQKAAEWNTFSDKWLAYQWFSANGVGTPKTWLPGDPDLADPTFPCIVKPRLGGGSRHIHRVKDRRELDTALAMVPEPIVQALVEPADQEYTAGTFRWSDGEVHVILFRRELKFGMTNKAWTVSDALIEKFCVNTINKSSLRGSNNIQLRVDEDGPKILEINSRFSGTTGIRANFGFNDVEMWIRDVLSLPKISPQLKQGSVVRYMEEIYNYE